MHFLLITYEYLAQSFSGNGLYAASQIALPSAKWGTLAADAAWDAFASACASPDLTLQLQRTQFDAVLTVDWHAALAWQRLQGTAPVLAQLPWTFLNYRMFSRNSGFSEELQAAERRAFKDADAATVLSLTDLKFAMQQFDLADDDAPVFLPPGIRQDAAAIPAPPDISRSAHNKNRRTYLTCAVRLSPEKEPGVFIALAADLHASGALARHSLTPLLLASARSPYADELRATFRAQVPTGVVHEAFLGPQELADVFAQTRLNVHPCQYDAYGMTVIEAASQGAPSVVHQGNGVGATHTLAPLRHEAFALDMSQPVSPLAVQLDVLLSDERRLRDVGTRAARAARAYDERSNAHALLNVLQRVCKLE